MNEQSTFTRTYLCVACGEGQQHTDIRVNRPSFHTITLDCQNCGGDTEHRREPNGFPGMKWGNDRTVAGSSGIHALDYQTNDIVKKRAIEIATEKHGGISPAEHRRRANENQ